MSTGRGAEFSSIQVTKIQGLSNESRDLLTHGKPELTRNDPGRASRVVFEPSQSHRGFSVRSENREKAIHAQTVGGVVSIQGDTVWVNDVIVKPSSLERAYLRSLMENGGKPVSLQKLYSDAHPDEPIPAELPPAIVGHRMRSLMTKAGDDIIDVVYGYGYRMKTPKEVPQPEEPEEIWRQSTTARIEVAGGLLDIDRENIHDLFVNEKLLDIQTIFIFQTQGGTLVFDKEWPGTVWVNNIPIDVTTTEFSYLELLVKKNGKYASWDELYQKANPEKRDLQREEDDTRKRKKSVVSVITKLRSKLGEDIIMDARFYGYRIAIPQELPDIDMSEELLGRSTEISAQVAGGVVSMDRKTVESAQVNNIPLEIKEYVQGENTVVTCDVEGVTVILDKERKNEFWIDGKKLPLRPSEFKILVTLIEKDGQVVTYEDFNRLLSSSVESSSKRGRTHEQMRRIRRKIGNEAFYNLIRSVKGEGYALNKTTEVAIYDDCMLIGDLVLPIFRSSGEVWKTRSDAAVLIQCILSSPGSQVSRQQVYQALMANIQGNTLLPLGDRFPKIVAWLNEKAGKEIIHVVSQGEKTAEDIVGFSDSSLVFSTHRVNYFQRKDQADPEMHRLTTDLYVLTRDERVRGFIGAILASSNVRDLGINDTIDDILSEAALKIITLESSGQGKEIRNLKTYFTSSAKNVITSKIRLAISARKKEEQIASRPIQSAEDTVIQRAIVDRSAYEYLLANLPGRQREVFELRFFDELSIKDIASRLGISEGAVKSHYHRAREKLKQILLNKKDE